MTDVKNPLLEDWTTAFQVPPFDRIEGRHFPEAFDQAMAEKREEIARIAEQGEAATFDNTIGAMERSGRSLAKVAGVFFNLAVSDTNDNLKSIERAYAPRLAKLGNEIFTDDRLFARADALMAGVEDLNLTPEQERVLERYHTRFVRSGAGLDAHNKRRLGDIVERLSQLTTQFAQNVLAEEAQYQLILETDEDLAGLPDFLRDAAAEAAAEAGLAGKYVITLSRSSIEPFLVLSERRDLREEAFAAWAERGLRGAESDNRPLIAEIVALRSERAKLLGYDNFAAYKLEDTMATRPEAVRALLEEVWGAARRRALEERDDLQEMVRAEGANFDLAAWDWRHYSEKVRKAKHDLDESAIKPYFELGNMIEAAFFTANQLFGLTFSERKNVPTYHPDVRVWEVADRDGRHLGIFLGDYFARPSKRSGAWSSAFRRQERFDGDVRPIVVNVMNFAKGRSGGATLLSFDDARTLFHEFGHGLHALLSDVTYPFISGTSVATDFVELPSQLFEHWLEQPDVLRRFAIHAETGEAIPETLLERLLAARNFGQGFATVEYLSSALVDLALHEKGSLSDLDVEAFEAEALAEIGMPREIIMRHRLPHFLHLFASDGYAAGYYSYMWSEVMDADAFNAFEEAGDIFDRDTAQRLRTFIYSSGGRMDPVAAYEAFRGRQPRVDALLEGRGLTA